MSIAVVFPGQGSQAPGAGAAWQDHPAWALVDEAEAATGLPLAHLLLDADEAELRPTRAAQLSVLLSSLLAWRALEPTLDRDDLVALAGHSLGQVTALIASGAVTLDAGLRLAVARADATAAAQDRTPGAMLAFLGATEDQADAACAAAPGRAWIANLNGAGQIVVGGEPDALRLVADEALAVGVRRVQSLRVDGAFHTPLMQEAADALAPTLAGTPFRSPRTPIVTNEGTVVDVGTGWPDRLTAHLIRPVRWGDVVIQLGVMGADTIIEAGPGTTLTGLTGRIAPDSVARSVSSPDHLPLGVER
ncbi:ACP S-malonyltransferase [Aquihabitans daechungensis]|uniref:ACP S-malonyltransferase n=1 Tax=Aquihabitans daechungensis TaxID=1052257 RepID=UPI003B9DDDAC